jgi:hypothetical protein
MTIGVGITGLGMATKPHMTSLRELEAAGPREDRGWFRAFARTTPRLHLLLENPEAEVVFPAGETTAGPLNRVPVIFMTRASLCAKDGHQVVNSDASSGFIEQWLRSFFGSWRG